MIGTSPHFNQVTESAMIKGFKSGQIKATHGKCLDASQRNRNGGKVHMWQCNVSNKNQQWTYVGIKGALRMMWGVELHTVRID